MTHTTSIDRLHSHCLFLGQGGHDPHYKHRPTPQSLLVSGSGWTWPTLQASTDSTVTACFWVWVDMTHTTSIERLHSHCLFLGLGGHDPHCKQRQTPQSLPVSLWVWVDMTHTTSSDRIHSHCPFLSGSGWTLPTLQAATDSTVTARFSLGLGGHDSHYKLRLPACPPSLPVTSLASRSDMTLALSQSCDGERAYNQFTPWNK